MSVVFTMKLEPDLRDAFMAAAAADNRPAAQVVHELMRGYIEQRQQAREYDEYLQRKVERARVSVQAGVGIPHQEVAAQAALQRAELLRHADATDP